MQKTIIIIACMLCAQLMIGQSTYSLWVNGACGMCQDRIENAAQKVAGVKKAKWNSQSKMLKLQVANNFDTLSIHHQMASIGHDTRIYLASQQIYDQLHYCCQYRDEEEMEIYESTHSVHEQENGRKEAARNELGTQIHGKVLLLDENGDTIPAFGATLRWLGTGDGVAADENGYFDIPPSEDTRELIISYVGYGSDTIRVKRNRDLNILLYEGISLETVSVSYRQRSTRFSMVSAGKTQYISREELCKAACCNLAESFETTPAIDAATTDAVTGTRRIEMLGLAGPYVQIMRENQPFVRGLSTLHGLEYIPGYWIQGIHLNTGAGSVVNGFESITGQINVAMHQPEEPGPNTHINLYGNMGGRFEANVITKHKVSEKWSTMNLLHGRHQQIRFDKNKDGFLDMPLKQAFIAVNRWRYKGNDGWNAQAGVNVVFSDELSGQKNYESRQESTALWGSEHQHRRLDGWLKLGRILESKNRSFGFQLSASYDEQDAYFGLRDFDATQYSLYGNFIYQSDFNEAATHKFRTGLSYQYDRVRETVLDTNFNRDERVPGVFYEYSFVPSKKWTVVAGLRLDHHNNFGLFYTLRLHARFSPDARTAIRLSGGRGQRTANVFTENIGAFASSRTIEIQAGGEALDANNPYCLQPEVAWNFGLNLTREIPLSNNGSLLLNADAYYTYFENQIVADYDASARNLLLYNLDGKSRSWSLQFQADADWSEQFSTRIAYRYNDVRTQYQTGYLLRPLLSKHRAFINSSYSPTDRWNIDATLSWQSRRRIPNTADNPVQYQRDDYAPSFFLLNGQITRRFSSTFEFYVGGENLLNFRQQNPIIAADDPNGMFFDASLVWGPIFGRNIYAGLRWEF